MLVVEDERRQSVVEDNQTTSSGDPVGGSWGWIVGVVFFFLGLSMVSVYLWMKRNNYCRKK